MRNKEATIENILKTATKLFTKKGFLKVSTLEIAEKAGIAHGTLFFHFHDRSELIVACIYKVMEKLAKDLNENARNTDDVEKICNIFLNEIDNYRNFYCRLVKDMPHLPLHIQRMVFSSLSGFSVHFVETIETAQKNKIIRNFEPKYAMFYWFGVINYMFMYSDMLGTKRLSEKDKKELVVFFMSSLKNLDYKVI
jgi:AcrR family transcriptional regulator